MNNLTKEVFEMRYWKNYLMLEKEFCKTAAYVSVNPKNSKTFSATYLKLLLEIGSEVDVVAKLLCSLLDVSKKCENISDYQKCINKNISGFCLVTVKTVGVSSDYGMIYPWNKFNIKSPEWWKSYNAVKHNRYMKTETEDIYELSNLDNTINALAGLFQLELHVFSFLLNGDEVVKIPLPGSRIFELCGEQWDNITFYRDQAFYIKDGDLFYETGLFEY